MQGVQRFEPHDVTDGRLASEKRKASSSKDCAKLRATGGPAVAQARAFCMEARMVQLLKQLAPAERQLTLAEHFSERQRLALERWILARKEAAKEKKLLPSTKNRRGVRALTGDLQKKVKPTIFAEPSRSQKTKGRLPTSGVTGLHSHRRSGRILYRASVVAGPFRLTTGLTSKIDVGQRYLQVLSRIRDLVTLDFPKSSHSEEHASSLDELNRTEERFRLALQSELSHLRFPENKALKLHFYACVPASYWVGQALSTPYYLALGPGLDDGLRAWRRLSEARGAVFRGRTNRFSILQRHAPEDLEAAWLQLRQTYIDVWADAGHCPQKVAARLRTLELKHRPCRERRRRRWEMASKVQLSRRSTGQHLQMPDNLQSCLQMIDEMGPPEPSKKRVCCRTQLTSILERKHIVHEGVKRQVLALLTRWAS